MVNDDVRRAAVKADAMNKRRNRAADGTDRGRRQVANSETGWVVFVADNREGLVEMKGRLNFLHERPLALLPHICHLVRLYDCEHFGVRKRTDREKLILLLYINPMKSIKFLRL